MIVFYLSCLVIGLVLCLLAAWTSLGHTHIGHVNVGHAHVHPPGHAAGGQIPAVNGFTVPMFLVWFGGTAYLLRTHTGMMMPIVVALGTVAGLIGAGFVYLVIFKFLLAREREHVLEETQMEGTVGTVGSPIREGKTGEIIYTIRGSRSSLAARSELGGPISRGTEVVVLRYDRGIAYVKPLEDQIP